MTEKRFTITQKEDYFYVRDEVNKKPMGMFEFKQDEFPVYFCFHKIIDLLNEQHETIQVLERHLDNMRCGALTDDKRIKELYDENEQLKAQLKDYHNAFDCSQCRYQNYDWFDDGDEFEVCDKGNNEEQMEYHSCKDWEEL